MTSKDFGTAILGAVVAAVWVLAIGCATVAVVILGKSAGL